MVSNNNNNTGKGRQEKAQEWYSSRDKSTTAAKCVILCVDLWKSTQLNAIFCNIFAPSIRNGCKFFDWFLVVFLVQKQ